MENRFIGRWLFTGGVLVEGYLRIEGNLIAEVCTGKPPAESSKAVIVPGFVNAHTHIGDAFAYPAPKGTVEKIVAPPNGYKHRKLREASREEKVRGIVRSVDLMQRSGTSLFADFREEGVGGIRMLRECTGSAVGALVLGRPESAGAEKEEILDLLRASDGLGMSSIRDWPYDMLWELSRMCRSHGKLFSVHASETVRDDIDAVMDLKPDFLVHMTAAAAGDLEICAQQGVPVVVCPRSNEFFGIDPRIPELIELGVEVAIGTDNAMICPPNMLDEVIAARRISASTGGLEPGDALHLATIAGRKVLNAEREITTEIGSEDDLTVVEVRGDNPMDDMVGPAGSGFVSAVCKGGVLRRL